MPKTAASPRITHLDWGVMTIEGLGSGKDFKLWPGGGRQWDWAETRTRHHPGIQPADVEELLTTGCTTIVLSQGMLGRLNIGPDTQTLLRRRKIELHVQPTPKAVKIYNQLADQGVAVGGLFHSTC